jgi:hypothetical protein
MMTTTQVKNKAEILKDQHDLVKGDFTPEEASEIINHLLTKKINFHELRSFSSEIRFGETDQDSILRVKELMQSRKSLNNMIKQAQETGKTLRIKSTISIEII